MPVLDLQPGAIISIPVCDLATSTADVRIGLAQVDGGDPGDTTPIFIVGNIEAAAAALASQHIATSRVVTVDGHTRLLTLQDPDRNTLMLQEEL